MLERSPVSWARNCTRASAERPTIALDTLLECCDASDKRRLLSLLLGAGSSSNISDGTQPSSRGLRGELENLHRNLSQNDGRNKKVASFVPLASAAAAADAKERLLPLIRPMLQILQPLPLTSDAQPNASDVRRTSPVLQTCSSAPSQQTTTDFRRRAAYRATCSIGAISVLARS